MLTPGMKVKRGKCLERFQAVCDYCYEQGEQKGRESISYEAVYRMLYK